MRLLRLLQTCLLGVVSLPVRTIHSFAPHRQWHRQKQNLCRPGLFKNDAELATDLAVVGTLGFGIGPLLQLAPNATKGDLKATFVYSAVDSIQMAARTYGVVLLADALQMSSVLPGIADTDLRIKGVNVALTVWLALTLSKTKCRVFENATAEGRMGRVQLYDTLLDVAIATAAGTFILGELEVDFGVGLQSILASGGLGAIFFSIASKELATNIIAGFAVQAWGAFDKGDSIRLEDGTGGTVLAIGLVETVLIGSDNIRINVPNSQLYNQKLSNLSRVQKSQVLQTLRFQYSDIQNVPKILDDIRLEIKKDCPDLILDGSCPFRAVLESYEPDHIRCQVNCHFDVPPFSAEFYENQERLLLAIAAAMEKNTADFAIPSIQYRTTGDAKGPLPPR